MTHFIGPSAFNSIMYFLLGAAIIGLALYIRKVNKISMQLKDCCTEEVDAVCTAIKQRGTYRYRRYNCYFRYQYKGRIYSANSLVWTRIPRIKLPVVNSHIKLMIDPSAPERIYDPCAAFSNFLGRYLSAVFVIFGLSIMAIPLRYPLMMIMIR